MKRLGLEIDTHDIRMTDRMFAPGTFRRACACLMANHHTNCCQLQRPFPKRDGAARENVTAHGEHDTLPRHQLTVRLWMRVIASSRHSAGLGSAVKKAMRCSTRRQRAHGHLAVLRSRVIPNGTFRTLCIRAGSTYMRLIRPISSCNSRSCERCETAMPG